MPECRRFDKIRFTRRYLFIDENYCVDTYLFFNEMLHVETISKIRIE